MTPATTRKLTSASTSREFEIVNVWMGGAKYQLSNRKPPTSATAPGIAPPMVAIATTKSR